MPDSKAIRAATQLEDLSVHLKALVVGLRDGSYGYRDVYAFRHAVGKVTAQLGVGVPKDNYTIELTGE